MRKKKKETRVIFSHLDRASTVNEGFYKWNNEHSTQMLGTKSVFLNGQDSARVIFSHLDRASTVNKGFYKWNNEHSTQMRGTKRVFPNGQDSAILRARW